MGVRRFQNKDGSLTPAGQRYLQKRLNTMTRRNQRNKKWYEQNLKSQTPGSISGNLWYEFVRRGEAVTKKNIKTLANTKIVGLEKMIEYDHGLTKWKIIEDKLH